MPDNQKGFVQVLVILLLLVGVGAAVWGIQNARTVLKPQASESNPTSANNLLNKVRDIESKAVKIDQKQLFGDREVVLPVTVFEDSNKNGIKDEGEVGIPNVNVEIKSYYSATAVGYDDKYYYDPRENTGVTDSLGNITWEMPGDGTVVDPETSENFKIELFHVYVSIYRFDTQSTPWGLAPHGWAESNEGQVLNKFYSKEPVPEEAPLSIDSSGETTLETAQFPLIGAQKISGQIFYDNDRNGIREGDELQADRVIGGLNILIDAREADNATRKLYYGVSNEDGTYEINNLPPLSQYRIKASPACPFVATTPTQSGLTLGFAGIVNYDFGVVYDENDPCVAN